MTRDSGEHDGERNYPGNGGGTVLHYFGGRFPRQGAADVGKEDGEKHENAMNDKGAAQDRIHPEIEQNAADEFEVHREDIDETEAKEVWACGFSACPAGEGDDDGDERNQEKRPAEDSVEALDVRIEILEHGC
jgi:hypothetical protein